MDLMSDLEMGTLESSTWVHGLGPGISFKGFRHSY